MNIIRTLRVAGSNQIPEDILQAIRQQSKTGIPPEVIAQTEHALKSAKAHVIGAFQTHFATGSVGRFGLDDHINMMRKENFGLYRKYVFIDATLAEWYREDVEEQDNHRYVITALFAEMIHSRDAVILYPSVRHFSGWNLAALGEQFHAKFEVLETYVVSVEKSYCFGLRDLRYISTGRSFNDDGTIVWDEKSDLKSFHALALDIRAERTGWRRKT
ncbi:hypothetical protein [Massilia sp. TWR1-2-2]|uniref:hypothetical protein n=1 Tax=Massilia sp. TWR1-2-2 TaxID=2804584 RepID=UPI003CF3C0C2